MTSTIDGFVVYGDNQNDIVNLIWRNCNLTLDKEEITLLSYILIFDEEHQRHPSIHVSRAGDLLHVYVCNFSFRITHRQSMALVIAFSDYKEAIESDPVDEDGWWDVSVDIEADQWEVWGTESTPAETTNWIEEGF